MDHSKHLMGRQPILNGLEEIVGFELLFRCPASLGAAEIPSPVRATSQVIFDILSSFGVRDVLGEHRGFINVDADMLMSDAIELLPTESIGLELLEDLIITPEIVERCRELKKMGCLLVLDDHCYAPEYEPLYQGIVDIVKLDLIATPLEEVYREVGLFRRYPVKLLAEKVDSRHVYLRSRKMGFELFQGYFFARPTLVQKTRMANASASFFRLMQQLSGEADIDEIEETFKQSPALTYKLLLLVNSLAFATREKIRTVRHAITQVGLEHLKRWVQLAIFADDSGSSLNNPLLDMAAVRAAFMEEMARLDLGNTRLVRQVLPEEAFMVGILSILKDIYEIDMAEIVANLNLSEELRDALVHRGGDLGTLLCVSEMMERLELDEAAQCLERLGVSPAAVLACQKRAYQWRSRFA
ncbi:EAL and HDOD domain-containing protein [Trichlorobacter ammonificans]|uniref:EAL and modified HD-GYP domain-containing signal transduction protein n=1 Tax=Trichlorobacter ammonificans TaxID=2916410 RepID=A0ABM9DAI1_9BACT|nr:HDOD domain-containing protein [Trichlorobacter ammonificans]CAH2031783.1 EAL and modified HD-GYP domain-containing signal transduction protein [Trichlorobacter ammonificans]